MKKNHSYGYSLALISLLLLLSTGRTRAQEENLNVFETGFDARNNTWIEWRDSKNMLIHHLNKQAFAYLDKRDVEIAGLKTKEDWLDRQKRVKDKLMELVGPFPEKTPLNARVTGIVKKDGFRIEKVIYESMPGYYVTACMFIPDGKGRKPAVIQVSGHTGLAFRTPGTETQLYNLVKRGFIVFAIDPIAQGERLQYPDSSGKNFLLGVSPVPSHSYFGNQMLISGISPIRYYIWDGIRGTDYLVSRKEVDPERIGIYGCSGGGTQTTFIAAFDDRIKAAVPGCYITGFRRLLESIGPQDAEQNVFHFIMNGLTHADLLEVRAPKPLLISSTTRDYFSIQGALETYAEVKKAYAAFGAEDKANQAIDDYGHGLAGNITTIYAFFQKELGVPGAPEEIPFKGFDASDLQVTPTGQVTTSLKGETAFSINKKESQKLIDNLNIARKDINGHIKNVLNDAKSLSGYAEQQADKHPVFRGRYRRDGYSIELHALHGEGDYIIPLLLFIPSSANNLPAVIYLNPLSKAAEAGKGGKIEQLVKDGYVVAAPDLIGTGETFDDYFGPMYESGLIGRSIPGIQAGDIGRVIGFLKNRPEVNSSRISGIAFDEMCPTIIHAAAFNNDIRSIALYGSLISYRTLVMNEFYEVRPRAAINTKTSFYPSGVNYLNHTVTGALKAYDLPDLIGCIAPRKVALINPTDHLKKPADQNLINEDMAFPKAAYASKNAQGNLKIVGDNTDLKQIIGWCLE